MDNTDIFISDLEKSTLSNTNYREVIYTTTHMQIVLQSIKPGSDIEYEVHQNNDQFVRVEQGEGKLIIGSKKEHQYPLKDGQAFIIPSNTCHQIINNGNTDLKLYIIYSPPHHPSDKIDVDRPPNAANPPSTQVNQTSAQIGGTLSNFEHMKKIRGFMY